LGSESFKNYSVLDGLAQSQIQAVCQDSKGYIWFGSRGGGVSRFDGVNFVNFTTSHGLANNVINSLIESKDKHLWIGTDQGLTEYDGSTFKSYFIKNGLPHNQINSLHQSVDGKIWIGTTEGLCYYQDGKITSVKLPINSKGKQPWILKVYTDHSNLLWIGTKEGIISYSNGASKRYTEKDGLLSNNVRTIIADKDNNLYIGTDLGLCQLKKGVFHSNPIKSKHLFRNNVNDLMYDYQGNLWIATDLGVFYCKSSSDVKYYNRSNGVTYEHISALLEDHENHIWLCSDGSGVDYFKGFLFESVTSNAGLPSDVVWSISKDWDGNYWFGHDDGLSMFDGENFIHYLNKVNEPNFSPIFHSKSSLSPNKPLGRSFDVCYTDKHGVLWVGSEGGMSFYKNGKFTHITMDDGLPSNRIFSMLEASDGSYWLGTREGIGVYKDGKIIRVITIKDGLADNRINAIAEDRFGKKWISTEHGISVYDGKKFVNFTSEQGLNNDFVSNLVFDEHDNVWACSYGGGVVLFKEGVTKGMNYKHMVTFMMEDGLSDNEILFVLLGKNGELFAGGNKGLNKIFTKDYLERKVKKFQFYGLSEGFFGVECNMAATYTEDNGTLWFGTIGGAIGYHGEHDLPNKIETKNNLTSIKLGFSDTTISNGAILDYKHNHIVFKFIGICFSDPKKVKYKYRLKGFDDKWSPATSEMSATFSNLYEGNYTFELISCNNDGVWNKKPLQFSFQINPPFYRTIWFYLLALIVIGSLIFSYIRWSQLSLKRKNKELEDKIQERTLELQDKNLELEKLSIVARETQNSVLICDLNGKMEWVNDGFTRLLGYTLEEYIEIHGNDIILSSSNPEIIETIKKSIQEKTFAVYESKVITKEDKKLHIQSTLTPILDENGDVKKIVIIDSDITELKQTEDALLRKNKDILDSIHYAYRIQQAMLPPIEDISRGATDSFVFFQPKDIVSGDFYWFHQLHSQEKFYPQYMIAAADCTGHGVPGAFMSMVGNNLINQIVIENNITKPSTILNYLNKNIKTALHQDTIEEGQVRDGMDISFCSIDPENHRLYYAGANRPLLRIRKNKEKIEDKESVFNRKSIVTEDYILDEFIADRKAIGGYTDKEFEFTPRVIKIEPGDSFYMYTDGYIDQFGGENGKKFMTKRFKQLLLTIQDKNMAEQHIILKQEFTEWLGDMEQIDDVLVIGIRFNE
jgi:PAS domain S-box-containing protein